MPTAPAIFSEEGTLAHAEEVGGEPVGVGHVFAWLADAIGDITARVIKTNEYDLNIVRHGETGITSLLWNGVASIFLKERNLAVGI